MHDYRIDDVGLSIKAVKFLKRNHIDYVSDLLELKNDDIYQFPGAVSQNVEEMIHLRNSFLTELGSDTLEPVDRAVIDNRNAVIYQIIPELRYMESFSLTYMTDDGEEVDDCSLAEAGFSYRMVHYLTRQGISTVMDFVKMDLTKLVCTRNIGKKSIQESFERLRPRIKYELGKREKEIRIIKKIWGYLKKEDILSPDGLDKALEEAVKNTFEKACELTDDAIEKLPDNPTIMSQIMMNQPLLLWLENYLESIILDHDGISRKRLEKEVPSWLVSYGTFDAALDELVEQLKIEAIDDRYRWRLPYLSEWTDSLKDNERKALTLKLQKRLYVSVGKFWACQEKGFIRLSKAP